MSEAQNTGPLVQVCTGSPARTGSGQCFEVMVVQPRHAPVPQAMRSSRESCVGRSSSSALSHTRFKKGMGPQAGQCDLAMCYMGRAMGPALPPGAVVLLKAVDPDAIIPGGEYVIVSRKIVTLRIVRLSDGEDKLRLVAGDKENYDDIILNVSDIKSVYKVKGKLIINS